jgi:multidrug transporter EmrE-like cation transporter
VSSITSDYYFLPPFGVQVFCSCELPHLNSVRLTLLFYASFGFSGLAVILFVVKASFNFEGKFKSSLILGVINSGFPFLMYCLAARWLPAGYSAILNATTPLMGALTGLIFFRERLTTRKWGGVLLGLVGIMVITTVGESRSTNETLAGVVACLAATACYGIAGFLTRRWISNKGGLDPKTVAFGSQIGATLFLLPFFIYSTTIGPAINWLRGCMGERACRRDRVYCFCLYSVFSPDRGYWSTAFADCYLFDPPLPCCGVIWRWVKPLMKGLLSER